MAVATGSRPDTPCKFCSRWPRKHLPAGLSRSAQHRTFSPEGPEPAPVGSSKPKRYPRPPPPPKGVFMILPFRKSDSDAPRVPGREERGRNILHREAKGLFDEVCTDPVSNLIAT